MYGNRFQLGFQMLFLPPPLMVACRYQITHGMPAGFPQNRMVGDL